MNKLLITLGLAIMLFALTLSFSMEELVVGKQLCVDGNNNINLEGIMCEKTEWVLFNFSGIESTTITFFLMMFGIITFFVGLSMGDEVKGCGKIIKDISRVTERRCGQEGDVHRVYYSCEKCKVYAKGRVGE